jgi:uncharacterized damage-inducible protein DinB
MSDALLQQFKTFAAYNAWANARLYEACGQLHEQEYLKPRNAFFGSLHGTLNHILVGDRIWLARFEGRESGLKSLDQQLYGELLGLKMARLAEDEHIKSYIAGLTPAALTGRLNYQNMAGELQSQPLAICLSHFFNHQTHHRGQAHGLLSQTDVAPPSLDLIYFFAEQR